MANKTQVLLDSNNNLFPNDASPFNLAGIKKLIISNLNNEDNIEAIIHFIGRSEAGNLPYGKKEIIEIDIQPSWIGVLFVANNIPASKKITFDFEAI